MLMVVFRPPLRLLTIALVLILCRQFGIAQDGEAKKPKGGNDAGGDLIATRPFARGDQYGREQRAKDDPHAGSDKPLLDRIAHQEYSTQRQRQAADPHHPLGAESLFKCGRCRRGDGRGRNRGLARRLGRRGLRNRHIDDRGRRIARPRRAEKTRERRRRDSDRERATAPRRRSSDRARRE